MRKHLLLCGLVVFFQSIGEIAESRTQGIPFNQSRVGDTYLTEVPGFYLVGGDPSPVPVQSHVDGMNQMKTLIIPRDASGLYDAGGTIGVVGIGMSLGSQIFDYFTNNLIHPPELTVVNACKSGALADELADVLDPEQYWSSWVPNALVAANLSPNQVQVVWLYELVGFPANDGPFPLHAQIFQQYLVTIVQILKQEFPNCVLCLLQGPAYAGYATTALYEEPYAYESAFSIQWLIEQQIGGDPGLNYDPAGGPVVAPWLGWGGYFWTPGESEWYQEPTFFPEDYLVDGIHFDPFVGRKKYALYLWNWWKSAPETEGWYHY